MVRFGVALAVVLAAQVAHADVVFKAKDHSATIDGMGFQSDGSLVVAGTFFGKLTVGKKSVKPTEADLRDGFVARIDAKGKVSWLVSTKGISQVSSLAVSATGDVVVGGAVEYMVGTYDGPATDWRARGAVLVLDANGKQRYRTELPSKDRSWVSDVAFASDGSIIACGSYADQTTFGTRTISSTAGPNVPSVDMFVTHLAAGDVDWIATGGGTEDDRCEAVAVAASGDVVVASDIGPAAKFGSQKLSGPVPYPQQQRLGNPSWAALSSYSDQGVLRWATQYQGHDSTYMTDDSLVVLTDGTALLRLEDKAFVSSAWQDDYRLIAVTSDGNLSSRTIDETEASAHSGAGLVTARLDVNDFVLDDHTATTSTPRSSVRRSPDKDLAVLGLARAASDRFALASTVSGLDATITFGTTAAELLPKRAK
jgi:hypothetical protein